jgi:hypothetical protein
MINFIEYVKLVSKFLSMFPLNKNETMPIVITKAIFHVKNVTKRKGVRCENLHTIQYFVCSPSANITAKI